MKLHQYLMLNLKLEHTLMTRKTVHARSFFFKDLAPPICRIKDYTFIES